MDELYTLYLNSELLSYQEANLENENEEFAQIVEEYRDGLLLFELMEDRIWNVSESDSIDIQKYYTENKSNYFWKKRIDAIIATCYNKKDIKVVQELLKSQVAIEDIKEQLNTNGKVNVIFTTGVFEKDHQALPIKLEFKEGQSKILKHNDSYSIVVVNKILPKSLKSYEEARGPVMSDYQAYKEKQWLETLREKYDVQVNQKVLDNVKKKLKS